MPTKETKPTRDELFTGVQSYALEVFKENNRIGALIEDKAQKVITIVGIIVGAALAFLRNDESSSPVHLHKYTLFSGLLVLLTSVTLAVLVTRVSANPSMPELAHRLEQVTDLFNLPDHRFTTTVLRNFNNELSENWIAATTKQTTLNKQKAYLLLAAQVLLVVALLLISAVLLMNVWAKGRA